MAGSDWLTWSWEKFIELAKGIPKEQIPNRYWKSWVITVPQLSKLMDFCKRNHCSFGKLNLLQQKQFIVVWTHKDLDSSHFPFLCELNTHEKKREERTQLGRDDKSEDDDNVPLIFNLF